MPTLPHERPVVPSQAEHAKPAVNDASSPQNVPDATKEVRKHLPTLPHERPVVPSSTTANGATTGNDSPPAGSPSITTAKPSAAKFATAFKNAEILTTASGNSQSHEPAALHSISLASDDGSRVGEDRRMDSLDAHEDQDGVRGGNEASKGSKGKKKSKNNNNNKGKGGKNGAVAAMHQ